MSNIVGMTSKPERLATIKLDKFSKGSLLLTDIIIFFIMFELGNSFRICLLDGKQSAITKAKIMPW